MPNSLDIYVKNYLKIIPSINIIEDLNACRFASIIDLKSRIVFFVQQNVEQKGIIIFV